MQKIIKRHSKRIFYLVLLIIVTLATQKTVANAGSGIDNVAGSPVNVRDFGASGDGIADDTEAIRAAVAGSAHGMVVFPGGTYRITSTIHVDLSENGLLGISGYGGTARIMMEGPGPAFRITGSHHGTASPASVTGQVWEKERMPVVQALEITGKHPEAAGLEIKYTHMAIINSVLIRNVHHGIHLRSRNRNVIITDSHIYNCNGVGIYLDSVNLHQIIISNSHISYNLLGGIKVTNSEIRNIQITGNDIEYNCAPRGSAEEVESADIWFDCSMGGSIREGTITSNTIQALPTHGGANIRFTGYGDSNEKIGLLSITGNHISSQMINIHLDNTHGISITGNTFIRGYEHNVIMENSRNIVLGTNVFDHNRDYATGRAEYAPGGITISNCDNIIMTDNIIDGVDNDPGGVITINESRNVSLRGNHISNPKHTGVQINSSKNILVSGCRIYETSPDPVMMNSIELNGDCEGTVLRHNIIMSGKKGDIINNAAGMVLIDGNITSKRN